ncbi:MAG TPA: DegT/DnrJ/EryC1/StrS family aminotransferase [Thermoanaerobaculia bacterium]
MVPITIPFNDLRPVLRELETEILDATERVLRSGWMILGPEVEAFEAAFAEFLGSEYAVGVANGTDAIELALRGAGFGPGDEVITVAHTAVATVCAIERTGAHPVLVDIDPCSYTIDPVAVEAAITSRTAAIVAVHLYGHPADMSALRQIATRHRLLLVEDCAQAHGARQSGRMAGTLGDVAAFSFYPTKNLGACGDGGAVVTSNATLAERIRRLRNYGQTSRYEHAERGINSRLDEVQAAILRVKLARLPAHNAERAQLAKRYSQQLTNVTAPTVQPGNEHAWHLYVVRHHDRAALIATLSKAGVGTLIHYPRPVHLQSAYADLGYAEGSLPVTEATCREILSLPLYPGLTNAQVDRVCESVMSAPPPPSTSSSSLHPSSP